MLLKAAVYYGPSDIRYENVPKPEVGSDEILVKMKACGICGSDLEDWYLKDRAPLVLGHEPTGVVAEAGKDVEGFEVGDRVFVHHHVGCLTCHYCTHGDFTVCPKFRKTNIHPGGFAEYFRVPADNLLIDTLKLPSEVSFEAGSLIEPIACCIRGLTRLDFRPGDSAAILGVGPMGAILTSLFKMHDASTIVVSDAVKFRLDTAKKLGADVAVDITAEEPVEAIKAATEGRGADVVIVATSSIKAYETAIKSCRRGGEVLVFAPIAATESLPLNMHYIFFNEVHLIPSYSTTHIETRMALNLLKSGRINSDLLITHKFPLGELGRARELAKKDKNCLKVVMLGTQ